MISLKDSQIQLLIKLFKDETSEKEADLGRKKFINLLALDLNTDDTESNYINVLTAFRESRSRREQSALLYWGKRFGIPEFQFEADRPTRCGAKK